MKSQNIIGAILILSGIVLLGFLSKYGFGNFAVYFGRALGQCLVFSLILLILVFISGQRKKVALLLVLGIGWIFSAGILSFELFDNGKTERKLAQETIDILDTISVGEKINYENTPQIKESVQSWMRGYMSRVQKIHSEFFNEINSSGLNEMLLPENLTNAETTEFARERVTILVTSITNYESRILEELYSAEDNLSKRTDRQGKEVYQGFMETKQSGIENTKNFYGIEKNIVITVGNILDLSLELTGKLHLQDGRLMFEEKNSLELYNSYLSKLSMLSEQESKILNKQQQKINATKNKLIDNL